MELTFNMPEVPAKENGPITLATTSVEYPITLSRFVTIFPKIQDSVLPEEGTTTPSAHTYTQKIGSAFAGKNDGRQLGRTLLTFEEEKRLMPSIIGVSPDNQEWDKMLNLYWINLSVAVPVSGLTLETGIRELSPTEWEPINLKDWLLYKYCLKYGAVANRIEDLYSSPRIRFYMMDSNEIHKVSMANKQLRDKATLKRMELESKHDYVRAILELSGNIVEKDWAQNELAFAELATNSAKEFLALAEDKTLLDKHFVERAIRAGFLTRPLNSTLVMYDGAVIGNNLQEASAWLKMPANSQANVVIRAKLEEGV
jgi:hypothetical protein